MSLKFGTGPPEKNPNCEICEQEVKPADKLVVEKRTIHNQCFKCAFCDAKLRIGSCAMEPTLLNRYGPLWFCSDHMLIPPGQKKETIVKKGYKEKTKGKK